MPLIHDLLDVITDGQVVDVSIGLHWTTVVIESDGQRRSGLASTLAAPHGHHGPDVPQAGQLTGLSGREMAGWVQAEGPTQRSLGFAALNALLPPQPETWIDINAEAVIAEHGAGKTVSIIGHFPFIDRLRPRVGTLHVLELNPRPGDLPAAAASETLPGSAVVAITAMTMLNGTFDSLLKLCQPETTVLVLGPTTPLSPIMFDYGVDLLSGSVVQNIEAVGRHVREGGNFQQVRKAGVRLVTMHKP